MQPSGGAPERVAGGPSLQIAAYGRAGVGNRRERLYYPRQLTDLLRRQSWSALCHRTKALRASLAPGILAVRR